jgi:hypothetical protein
LERRADVVVRPGLRERFSFADQRLMNNKFWKLFALEFHLCWPYELNDVFGRDDNGLYYFSGLYEKTFRNINAWTMDFAFFEAFPDLYDDIMPYAGIPRSIDTILENRKFRAKLQHMLQTIAQEEDSQRARVQLHRSLTPDGSAATRASTQIN